MKSNERISIASEYSFNANSLYFDFQPARTEFAIAYVRRVTDSVYLDVDRGNGKLLGIEIPQASHVLQKIGHSRYKSINRRHGRASFKIVVDILNSLIVEASDNKNLETEDFLMSELSAYTQARRREG